MTTLELIVIQFAKEVFSKEYQLAGHEKALSKTLSILVSKKVLLF